MDTLQLNRINELAREYLRLGIAKSTSDAVEKARFQLAFEQKKPEPEASPYEVLFAKQQEEKQREQKREEAPREISPLDNQRDRVSEVSAKLSTIQSETEQKLREQQSRIAQLEQTLSALRSEVDRLKSAPRAEPQTNPAVEEAKQERGPIASTIEQTIKGRKISSEDVSVDKIFYFGNR